MKMKEIKAGWTPIILILLLAEILFSCASNRGSGLPEIKTSLVSGVTQTTAVSGGIIISTGDSDIIGKGLCWGFDANPTLSDNHTVDGTGKDNFVSTLTALTPDTFYHLRAYATNSEGTSYGNNLTIKTLSSIPASQIIADHTVVDKYDDIPQYYIDQVKKMWLSYAGESHADAIRMGLVLLENLDAKYSVSQISSGTPEPYTTANLRVNEATWGSYRTGPTGWVHSYGEQDWFTSAGAIAQTKAGLDYCASNGPALSAFGFGWCYDPTINYTNIDSYISATQEYIDYCAARGYPTKIFFTTGPIDGDSYTNSGAGGLYGLNIYKRMVAIRDFVALDPSRILFDYADILSHDADGSESTLTYNGNAYQVITPTNGAPVQVGHISNAGALRLAKAMWWMLARMAGWDG